MRSQISATSLSRRWLAVVLAAAASVSCSLTSTAQTAADAESRPVSIDLVPSDRVSEATARAVAMSEAEIARSAQVYGYTLDSSFRYASSFRYQEIACPFAAHHRLLRYQDDEAGLSQFTAILSDTSKVVRGGRNPVQIIPILHHGVVPFVPAWSNPHSIEVFNRALPALPIRSQNSAGQPLLLRSLCYLAMVGADPAIPGRSPGARSVDAADQLPAQAPVPTLAFLEKGRARQTLSLRGASATYQVWTLTYSAAGNLTAVERSERPVEAAPPIRQPSVQQATNPGTTPLPPPPAQPAAAISPSPSPIAADNSAITSNPLPPPSPASPSPAKAASHPSVSHSARTSSSPPVLASTAKTPATARTTLSSTLPLPPERLLPPLPPPPGRILPESALPPPPLIPQKQPK